MIGPTSSSSFLLDVRILASQLGLTAYCDVCLGSRGTERSPRVSITWCRTHLLECASDYHFVLESPSPIAHLDPLLRDRSRDSRRSPVYALLAAPPYDNGWRMTSKMSF